MDCAHIPLMVICHRSNMRKKHEIWCPVFVDHYKGLRRRYSKLKNINSIDNLSGKDIFKLAESGDNIAINVIDDFYKNIAIGIYNLTFILNPEKIIIGGAISRVRS